jgi:hypothetical protein
MWHVWERRDAHSFGGKPERERLCVRTKHRWEGNIKMGLKEVGWEGVD